MMAKQGLTTHEVRNRIRNRYQKRTARVGDVPAGQPEYAVMFEVPYDGLPRWDGATPSQRRLDALAVGLWRSTEHRFIGFEIKVSRSDLLAELRRPEKAERGAQIVDSFYLVLGDKGILKPDDPVPDDWGILVPHGRGLAARRWAKPHQRDFDAGLISGAIQAAHRSASVSYGLGAWYGYSLGARK